MSASATGAAPAPAAAGAARPRRLRIAFVVDGWDADRAGGIQSARRVVAALRRNHDVTVVTSGDPATGEEKRVLLPSFTVWPYQRRMRENGFIFAWPRREVLEAVFRESDVVHVQFPFLLGMRAAALANRMGRPLVSAHHVQPENILHNMGIRSAAVAGWVHRLFMSRLYNLSRAVVCPSPLSLEELREHGLRVPAEVISSGIPAGFGPRREERFERHHGRFLVLAVGRLAREKRLEVVVEGVRRSRHADRIQLVLTGRGPDEARVRGLAAGLPVPAEIGLVSEADLQRLMNTADVMIHASDVGLEGMAVLEALGTGLPALIADAPTSASRQLAASADFLFRPGDPEDLARRLDRMVERPALLAEARRRCLELAGGHGFDESVRRLEALYERVASAGAAPSAGR
jgi:1,2-diacylglycerol 3-alpha-glucosyltransferase